MKTIKNLSRIMLALSFVLFAVSVAYEFYLIGLIWLVSAITIMSIMIWGKDPIKHHKGALIVEESKYNRPLTKEAFMEFVTSEGRGGYYVEDLFFKIHPATGGGHNVFMQISSNKYKIIPTVSDLENIISALLTVKTK
jgi:hypothetical protein